MNRFWFPRLIQIICTAGIIYNTIAGNKQLILVYALLSAIAEVMILWLKWATHITKPTKITLAERETSDEYNNELWSTGPQFGTVHEFKPKDKD